MFERAKNGFSRVGLSQICVSVMLPVLLTVVLLVNGCREVPVDRLYALHLDHYPTRSDWATALPRLVTVRGGYENRPARLGDIDEDSVHTSTASCHHGSSLPDPVQVDMRAFYTERDLFLRISWEDPTRDDGMRQWTYDGDTWSSTRQREDGFGLMWDAQSAFPRFTCSYACHIDDFGVSGANFHARNSMRLDRSDVLVDLWNWKADRTARNGFADDRYLDDQGMVADVPGKIFRPNSVSLRSGAEPFSEDDSPLYDDENRPIDARFRLAGESAPGYLVDPPAGGRGDVAAISRYENGRWTVVLRRALDTGDSRDVVFIPEDQAGVAFGLSIMDNTLDQHYASTTEERMVLLSRSNSAPGDVQ